MKVHNEPMEGAHNEGGPKGGICPLCTRGKPTGAGPSAAQQHQSARPT